MGARWCFRDLSKIEEGIGDKVTIFTINVSTFISGLVVAFIYGWKLALICMINLPVTGVVLGFLGWVNKHIKLHHH